MSSIPPNIVGPILQSGVTQRQASRILESEREQQERASESASRVGDRLDAVDETDSDTQVQTDSEGIGSQGRLFDTGEQAHEGDEPTAPESGISRDAQGQLHLDLNA